MVIFDFDGTLIDCDSFPLFATHVLGKRKMMMRLLKNLPILIRWKMGMTDASTAKEKLFSSWFKGIGREEAERLAETFTRLLERHLRPEARKRLEQAESEGEKVVIISASPGLWILPWARLRDIEVIATEVEWSGDCLTGRFSTPNCKGEEKVRRFRKRFGAATYPDEAWGDSRDDLPMLRLAAKRVWVGKGKPLYDTSVANEKLAR